MHSINLPGFVLVIASVLALSTGCSSSGPVRNYADVTVGYDVSRADVLEAYRAAFETLERVSYESRGDSLFLGASTDPDFPADILVRVWTENDETVVNASFSYELIDRFDHFAMMLEQTATQNLPPGSANLRPEVVYPSDLGRCVAPAIKEGADVVPPELFGGPQALREQMFYSPGAKEAGIEGIVFAGFVVDEKGKVECVEIISGLPAGMNDQVIGAILVTNFRAGTVDGRPVAMRAELPWAFRAKSR